MIGFHLLSLQTDSFVSLEQEETLSEAGSRLQISEGVDTSARKRPAEVDQVIRILSYSMLEVLSNVISSNTLKNILAECPEQDKFYFQRNHPLLVFDTRSESEGKALIFV